MYHPHTAFMVLTTGCNRRDVCEFCFYNVEPERIVDGMPDTAAVVDIMGKLRLSGFGTVILTGGEPTMRADLPVIVGAASRMGLSTVLLTNGTLLDENLVSALERAGLDSAAMSLCDLGASERDTATLLQNSNAIRLSFIFCFTKINYAMIPAAVDFAREFGAEIILQPAYIPPGHPLEEDLSIRKVDPFELSRIYTLMLPWARGAGCMDYLKLVYDFYTERSMKPARCPLSGNALVVDADCRMYPCFHRRDLCCGSANGDDFSISIAGVRAAYPQTMPAPCFGEHCLSLFTGIS